MLGFAFYAYDWWYAGVSETFHDFCHMFSETEMFSNSPEFYPTVEVLTDVYQKEIDQRMGESIYFESYLWLLTPRSQKRTFETLNTTDPYVICESLDRMFTNARKVMQKHPGGSPDADYIAASIRNAPGQLMNYLEISKSGNVDGFGPEELDEIVNSLRNPGPNLSKVISYYHAQQLS